MTNVKPPSSSNTVYDILALIGLLLLSLSAVITFALSQSSAAAAASSSPIIMNWSDSHYNTSSSAGISYDTQNMTHRSAKAEWQPHRAQSAMSGEWWYLTALLHDASGKQYMLFTTILKYDGKETAIAKAIPQMAAMLGHHLKKAWAKS